jgi:hypothetical protein
MAFQTVERAVELKKLIDHAHLYLPQVGHCRSLEKGFFLKHSPNSSAYKKRKASERDVKTYKALDTIQEKLGSFYGMEGYSMGNKYGYTKYNTPCYVTVQDTRFNVEKISIEVVEKWYASATSSGYGNVAAQETKVDSVVRSSKEFDSSNFSVEGSTLQNIAETWAHHFSPTSVTVQPYKLIIYGPGDHFTWHKDTPEENLCGTFLISLFNNCQPEGVFELTDSGGSTMWSESKNSWCAFYPDIPHQVSKVKSGYRAVLSFKIFVKEPSSQLWDKNIMSKTVNNIITDIQKVQTPVGILMKHHYGYDSKNVYGCDRLLLDGMVEQKLNFEMKPVLIRFRGVGAEEDDPRVSVHSTVHWLTEEALDVVRTKLAELEEYELESINSGSAERQTKDDSPGIVFIDGDKYNPRGGPDKRAGFWSSRVEDAAESLGNESRPYSEQSIYVRYAIIVEPSNLEVRS